MSGWALKAFRSFSSLLAADVAPEQPNAHMRDTAKSKIISIFKTPDYCGLGTRRQHAAIPGPSFVLTAANPSTHALWGLATCIGRRRVRIRCVHNNQGDNRAHTCQCLLISSTAVLPDAQHLAWRECIKHIHRILSTCMW
jgi:hypothetical protein